MSGELLITVNDSLFTCHCPLERLHDEVRRTAVIGELLCTVMHWHARRLAQELVMCAFIGVLESAPSTDIVDEDGSKIIGPADNVFQELA